MTKKPKMTLLGEPNVMEMPENQNNVYVVNKTRLV
jgi:hypothetical protein